MDVCFYFNRFWYLSSETVISHLKLSLPRDGLMASCARGVTFNNSRKDFSERSMSVSCIQQIQFLFILHLVWDMLKQLISSLLHRLQEVHRKTPTELIPLEQALQGAFLSLMLPVSDTLKLFLTLEFGISLLFLQENIWDFFTLFPYSCI